jgi:lysozyme
VSHTYNTGGSDTLFKLINSDASKKKIHNWFVKTYITSAGILIPGLVIRRKREADIFFLK